MNWIKHLLSWGRGQAVKSEPMKFRSAKEAADFVRRVQKKSGGPNARLIAMRERYVEVHAAKRARAAAGPDHR